MIYPETFEDKIGFTAIRHELSANCSGEKGKEYAEAMRFSTDPEEIILALERTAEMLSILTSGEAFPLGGLHNVAPALMRCRVEGASLTLEELHRLRQTLVSSAEVAFFSPRIHPTKQRQHFRVSASFAVTSSVSPRF